MKIAGSVAMVTGANRGLGAAFCRALMERGAAKVYGGARAPGAITTPGIEPVQLDITKPEQVTDAAAACPDVTLLINNAGILTMTPAVDARAFEAAGGRQEFETNVFGTLAMSQAFAPVLGANGGGAIVNVLSVLSWFSFPGNALYCASKAAAWSLTNSLRQDLHAQGTQVVALHVGLMDTDMAARWDAPKTSPVEVAAATLDAIESGAFEVLADDVSRTVRGALAGDLTTLYPVLVGGEART